MTHISRRPIPKKIIPHGNPHIVKMMIGWADSQLTMFERQMQGRGQTVGQCRRVHPNGTVVVCRVSGKLRKVDIYVGGDEGKKKREIKECWCNCNFSLGQILSVDNSGEYPVMRVQCCNDEDHYTIYDNLIGSDYTPWEQYMRVIVMAYNEFLFDCANANFDARGCAPIVSGVGMESPDWRTTYRVVPVCAFGFSKWLSIREVAA